MLRTALRSIATTLVLSAIALSGCNKPQIDYNPQQPREWIEIEGLPTNKTMVDKLSISLVTPSTVKYEQLSLWGETVGKVNSSVSSFILNCTDGSTEQTRVITIRTNGTPDQQRNGIGRIPPPDPNSPSIESLRKICIMGEIKPLF